MLQPYRVTFYEKLAKIDPDLEWTFYYGFKNKNDGKPGYEGITAFPATGYKLYEHRTGPYIFRYNIGLYHAVKKKNPDLIILQSISGNFTSRLLVNWAKRHKKKIILWSCGWDSGVAKGIYLRLKEYFAAHFYRKADFHLTFSSTATFYAERMGVDRTLITTCYNGIEIDHLIEQENIILERSRSIRSDLKLDNHITFLYVGALALPKRLNLLIDAFIKLHARYKNIKLMIIGDGPQKEPVLSKINAIKNEDIIYLGRIVDQVDAYFAAADCFVLPGIGGLALNQAMFWRKTCIVSKADGTEDDLVIDGMTGFRFEKDNQKSLEEAMKKRIMLSEEATKTMGDTAYKFIVQRSNVNNMVYVFSETINRLLSSPENR